MADKRISQLPSLSSLLPNAKVAVAQNGVTYQVDALKVAQLFGTNTSNTVLVDGTTITGDGASVPLSAIIPPTSVHVDNTTIGGNGTEGNPLTFIGTANVVTDSTLTGNGSATSPLSVVNPLPNGSELKVLRWVGGVPTWTDDYFVTQASFTGSTLTLVRSGGLTPLTATINVGSDGWGSDVVQTDSTLKGNGTSGSLLGINTVGAAAGEVLTYTGTGIAWATITGSGEAGDGWGSDVVQSDSTLDGNGTAGSLLSVANPLPAAGTNGQVLTVSGGSIVWADFSSSGLTAVATDSTLNGDGTGGDPLSVANPLPAAGTNGQVLTVVSGNIEWATPTEYLSAVSSDATLTGDGTSGSPLGVANPLPETGSNGHVLTVVGGVAAWTAAQNNYITSISVSGTLTKTITITRQGLSNLTATFTDNTASSGGDNWGVQTVVSDSTLTGVGITGNVLSVSNPLPAAGSNGQVLTVVSGNIEWADLGGGGLTSVASDSTLNGDGTGGDPLSVANPLPSGVSIQTLYHNGTAWTASYTIQQDGSKIGLGGNVLPNIKINAEGGAGFLTTLAVTNLDSTQDSKAIDAYSAVNSGFINVAGRFRATNSGAGTAYALRLEDGNEGAGKVLTCVNGNGYAEWQDLPTGVSGVENQTIRFNASNELEASGLILNDGSTVAIGGELSSAYKLKIEGDTLALLYLNKTGTVSGTDYGIYSRMVANGSGTSVAGRFEVVNTNGGATGVWGTATGNTSFNVVAGQFTATNNGSGEAYGVRIEDGSQGVDKILKSVDGNGHAQWSAIIPLLKESSIPSYAPSGTTQTIDLANNLSHTLHLGSATGDVTVTLSNPRLGVSYIIEVTQDNSTAHNIVWPGNVDWAGGTAPTISTGANAVDTIVLWYNGTNFRAVYSQNFS